MRTTQTVHPIEHDRYADTKPGDVLPVRLYGRQWQATVRGTTDTDGVLRVELDMPAEFDAALAALPNPPDVPVVYGRVSP